MVQSQVLRVGVRGVGDEGFGGNVVVEEVRIYGGEDGGDEWGDEWGGGVDGGAGCGGEGEEGEEVGHAGDEGNEGGGRDVLHGGGWLGVFHVLVAGFMECVDGPVNDGTSDEGLNDI